MFKHQLVPNINLFERIQPTKLDVGSGVDTMRLQRVEKPETQDFKAVFSGLVENLNTQMEAPDNMMKDMAMGNSNVDIHDVMTAMAKAELGVNIATGITGKIIQAYDKISQIQI